MEILVVSSFKQTKKCYSAAVMTLVLSFWPTYMIILLSKIHGSQIEGSSNTRTLAVLIFRTKNDTKSPRFCLRRLFLKK